MSLQPSPRRNRDPDRSCARRRARSPFKFDVQGECDCSSQRACGGCEKGPWASCAGKAAAELTVACAWKQWHGICDRASAEVAEDWYCEAACSDGRTYLRQSLQTLSVVFDL